MGKIVNTILFIVLSYLIPLLGRPGLLLHYKMGLLIAAAIAVFLTQPSFRFEEARAGHDRDRNSVLLILALSVLAAAAPVIEWAYWHPERHNSLIVAFGLFMVVAGIGLRSWAIRKLGRLFTATVQLKEEHQLIKDGPYRLVRHPSYLGALLAILGCAVILQSWIGLLIALLCMLIAYSRRIQLEEKALLEAFGEQYATYQQQSKKMIPFVW